MFSDWSGVAAEIEAVKMILRTCGFSSKCKVYPDYPKGGFSVLYSLVA